MLVREGQVVTLVDNLQDVAVVKYERASNTLSTLEVITWSETM